MTDEQAIGYRQTQTDRSTHTYPFSVPSHKRRPHTHPSSRKPKVWALSLAGPRA